MLRGIGAFLTRAQSRKPPLTTVFAAAENVAAALRCRPGREKLVAIMAMHSDPERPLAEFARIFVQRRIKLRLAGGDEGARTQVAEPNELREEVSPRRDRNEIDRRIFVEE